ncbi:hypothetical protein J6590_014624 [Homalodisca vitripennis]|nr:hypothetical protein J6590_014624 [Homalodisca vitripennis]
MSRVSFLKGTGYTVHREFLMEVRHKRSCLAAVRSEVERVAGRMRMPLAFDHLNINSIIFTWTDGKLMTGQRDGADQLKTLFNHSCSGCLDGLESGLRDNSDNRELQDKREGVLIQGLDFVNALNTSPLESGGGVLYSVSSVPGMLLEPKECFSQGMLSQRPRFSTPFRDVKLTSGAWV